MKRTSKWVTIYLKMRIGMGEEREGTDSHRKEICSFKLIK